MDAQWTSKCSRGFLVLGRCGRGHRRGRGGSSGRRCDCGSHRCGFDLVVVAVFVVVVVMVVGTCSCGRGHGSGRCGCCGDGGGGDGSGGSDHLRAF